MGDTLKREMSMDPVDTGQHAWDERIPGGGTSVNLPMQMPPGQPGQQTLGPENLGIPSNIPQQPPFGPQPSIHRPSFLQAFLANLGPALAGGMSQYGPQGEQNFATGLAGGFAGVQNYQQKQFERGMQMQQQQRLAQQAQMTQAVQQQELSTAQQELPLKLRNAKLEGDLRQAQVDTLQASAKFYSDPGNLTSAADDAFKAFGKLSPEHQALKDAAVKDAQMKKSFDPIMAAVKAVAEDKMIAARKTDTPAEMGLADYLADPTLDPGKKKNAATFIAWKAKQSPTMIVMGNMLGPSGPGTALDQQAERYFQTGELPTGLTRSPGTTTAIIQRAAQLHPEGNLAANKATFAANANSLRNLQRLNDQVEAFSQTANKNLDQVIETGKNIPELGAQFANTPVRAIAGKVIGTANMAKFNVALKTARTETARVLSSATAAGVLTIEQQREVNDVLNGNLPYPAMVAAIQQFKIDMENRKQAYQSDLDAIKSRMTTGTTPTTPPPSSTDQTQKKNRVVKMVP